MWYGAVTAYGLMQIPSSILLTLFLSFFLFCSVCRICVWFQIPIGKRLHKIRFSLNVCFEYTYIVYTYMWSKSWKMNTEHKREPEKSFTYTKSLVCKFMWRCTKMFGYMFKVRCELLMSMGTFRVCFVFSCKI